MLKSTLPRGRTLYAAVGMKTRPATSLAIKTSSIAIKRHLATTTSARISLRTTVPSLRTTGTTFPSLSKAFQLTQSLRTISASLRTISASLRTTSTLSAIPSTLTSTSPSLLHATLSHDRKTVVVSWSDGATSRVLPFWLRLNCNCHTCVQPHSGQRRILSVALNLQDEIKRLWLDTASQMVHVEWQSDGHQSTIPITILQTQRHAPQSCSLAFDGTGVSRGNCAAAVEIGGIAPHHHHYKQVMDSDHHLHGWLRDMAVHGAALVYDAPLDPLVCQQLASRISQAMPTIYGVDFDVEAMETPINIAYSTDGLDLHQDLAYYESTPGLQFLHCLAFDETVQGGYSTMMDAFALAERFRQQFPADFQALTTIPTTFQKIHFERELPACMVAQKPIIKTNKHGCIVDVVWSPPFEGPLVVDDAEEAVRFYQAYTRFATLMNESSDLLETVRLQPGQVLTFNNRRMLHGRTPFMLRPGTRRHLKGVYVNIDEFSSRLHVLTRTLGHDPADLPRHIGNGQ